MLLVAVGRAGGIYLHRGTDSDVSGTVPVTPTSKRNVGITALVYTRTVGIPTAVVSITLRNPRICPEAVYGNSSRVMVFKDCDTPLVNMIPSFSIAGTRQNHKTNQPFASATV